mmetsp:Transcript_39768/g.105338  ORF Transcript_39768/g.105338 Transcript_39768/m.105338 type:complete len:225 (+) Transcript_39768:2736-3410(+)
MFTVYLPGGASICKEFRRPRCSPIQSPSGTDSEMRTRSRGSVDPASMNRTEGTWSSTVIEPNVPVRERDREVSLTRLGPTVQPEATNMLPSARSGNCSTQVCPLSWRRRSSFIRETVPMPMVTKKGEPSTHGLRETSYLPGSSFTTSAPRSSDVAMTLPDCRTATSEFEFERSAGSQRTRNTHSSSTLRSATPLPSGNLYTEVPNTGDKAEPNHPTVLKLGGKG